MNHWRMMLVSLTALTLLSGCAHIPGETDLSDVARDANLGNVTTGDGTYEDYTATGHYTGTEVGIGLGLPILNIKFKEFYPARTNEDLLTDVARAASSDGADGMINVTPTRTCFTGFPFFILGVYVDQAEGTGIAIK